MPSHSPLTTALAFATATAGVTLAVAWPSHVHADSTAPLVQYMVDGVKVGDVVAKGRIEADPKSKSGWSVFVTMRNDADHVETVPIETDVTETVSSPMARTMPMPHTAWSTKETVTLSGHASMTRKYELPAALAQKIVAERNAQAQAHSSDKRAVPPTMTLYAVAFQRESLSSVGRKPAESMIY